jgi:hypothetical protein
MNEAVKPSSVAARNGPGALDSPLSLPTAFEFNADQGESDVSLKLSVKVFGTGGDLGVTDLVSFTGKAPIDKSSPQTALASLKGLGDAASLEAKYTHIQMVGAHGSTDQVELARICRVALKGYIEKEGKAPDPAALSCRDEAGAGLNNIDNAQVKTYAPDEYAKFKALYFDPTAHLWMWGATGQVGAEKFDYRDPGTFAELSTRETPWSVGAYVAYERLSWQTLITLKGDHKRVYKAADKDKRCANPADAKTCVEAAFGPPTKEDQDIVALEIRRRMGALGLAFTARYDVGEGTVALELPIYFIRDDSAGFNGGVKATWDSKTNDGRIGVFVSKAFKMFGDL